MSAVTDSDAIVKYDIENKPGISNLMNIYSVLTNKSIEDIELEFNNKNYGEFKSKVADVVVDELTRIQKKYNEIVASDELDKILDDGINITRKIPKRKFELMKQKIGLNRN